MARLDTSIAALEQAKAKKDWNAIEVSASRASDALYELNRMGAAVPALLSLHEQPKLDDLRAELKLARQ